MSPEGSVLIIDDEIEIRESLEQLLSVEGYRVASAPTADEGLKKAQEGIFDLVLLDINLPDRDGLEVLKILRHDTPDLGVVMITAVLIIGANILADLLYGLVDPRVKYD